MKTSCILPLSLAVLLPTLLLVPAGAAAAQCSGDALLDPQGPGANGQTWLQNFLTLVGDLYGNPNVTKRLFFDGNWHLVAPWFRQSDRCGEADLQSYAEFTSPTFSRYLVNGDELSELAVVTALADSEQRMLELHHTIQAMINGGAHFGLPCWLAKVESGVLSCLRTDSASDITARFGLAYLHAARNPHFSLAWQAEFRDAAAELARHHLESEYAKFDPGTESCPTIAPTNRSLCDWLGGGGNTSSRGSFQAGDTHMWIGYYPDVARFLIAVAESESGREPTLASRAREVADQVVEQWTGAMRFDGSRATFGDKHFVWDTGASPIQPRIASEWDTWDYDDAPRALWMGDVLRAIHLHSRGAALTGAYSRLSSWVQLLLAGDTQRANCSVIKYSPDGQPLVSCNAGFYENGLGAGLFTFHSTDLLDEKLAATLAEYRWADKSWCAGCCFGIYRPIRPLKALAAAIGLDSTAYRCDASSPALHLLSVQRSGTGAGTVASSPAGIQCGADCSESYSAGSAVTLTATASTGSTFTGWSGGCSGTGACHLTMDSDRSVSATFTLPSPSNLLANPSFEQGTSGWFCNGCTHVREHTVVADGQESALIDNRMGSWAGPTQTVTQRLTNGKTYTVSGLIKTKQSGGSTARFTFYLKTKIGTDVKVTYVPGPQGLASATQFTRISGNVTLQWSGTLEEARLYAETSGNSEDFYIDDVVLSESP